MDKYTGKRLDGRYEIQELIGVGGMAMVYRAYDSLDSKTVAIKILKDEFLGNEDFIRRFKNESKAIAILSHKNIVKVNDVSFGDRIQYIVMEYIEGITLKEYISSQKEIKWKDAVHFTVQILEALQHAHEKGIVHRDIKPQNIILQQDGTIKVTDFGIARFSNAETRMMSDKTAIGSVHYIAPEQARGEATDGKSDIYSVGVMLYEMLTGKLPFEADSAVSVAIMQLQSDPTPPRELNINIPVGLEEITLKAMRKDPAQRYASAREMLEALEVLRHNPAITFDYRYFVDEMPTKYVETINNLKSATPEPIYDDHYNMDEEIVSSRSRTTLKWITVGVAFAVIISVIIFVIMIVARGMTSEGSKDIPIPNFVGKMYDEIINNKDYKFNFETTAKYDETLPMGIILDQDPKSGADSKHIKETTTIKLTINSESTEFSVPKVKNYKEEEAINKLTAVYFQYEVTKVYSDSVEKGYVVNCTPQEGSNQAVGTKITLIISDGPAPKVVEVPNVVGETYERAKQILEAKGFTTQKNVVASKNAENTVVSTDPIYSNQITEGTLITINVSDGSLATKSLTQTLQLPENEAADILIAVYVDGELKEEKTQNPSIKDTYDITISALKGTKQIDVTIDGIKYATYKFDFTKETIENTYINEKYKPKQPIEEESSEPSEEPIGPSEEPSTEEPSDPFDISDPFEDPYFDHFNNENNQTHE